jgi:hypothetical protein
LKKLYDAAKRLAFTRKRKERLDRAASGLTTLGEAMKANPSNPTPTTPSISGVTQNQSAGQ